MRLRPVYFQHLQKTGGTSILETLGLFFLEGKIASDPHLADDQSISCSLKDLQEFDFVHSHSEILSTAPKNAITFCFFRHPLSRLASARRQYMLAGDDNLAAAPAEMARSVLALRTLSLTEILHRAFEFPRIVSSLWNHQALSLGAWPLIRQTSHLQNSSAYAFSRLDVHFETGQVLKEWLSYNKGRIMAGARQALQSLSYVGLTEDFGTSICEIFARIGLPEPGEAVVRNARRPLPDEEDPALRDAAADFLDLDYELYALARERYELQRRVARGTPVDYVGRWLSTTSTCQFSNRDAPGGHGWYPAHLRADHEWARWTGPGLHSRFATSAEPGRYRMILEVYGAASGRSLYEVLVIIEDIALDANIGLRPDGVFTITAMFERETTGRFDIVLKLPDVGLEYGLEVKQLTFEPCPIDPDG